jgi:hypothetical protein
LTGVMFLPERVSVNNEIFVRFQMKKPSMKLTI